MRSLGLKNIKAFKDTGDIKLAPLTIFVGQNSCGKSSFIRFPVVLSQSFNDESSAICLHSNQPGTIDYGNFEDVLHQHKGNSFSFSFSERYIYLLGSPKNSSPRFRDLQDLKTDCMVRSTITFTRSKGQKANEIYIGKYDIDFDGGLAYSFVYSKGTYALSIKKMIEKGEIKEVDYCFSIKQQRPMLLRDPISEARYSILLKDKILEGIINAYFPKEEGLFEAAKKAINDESNRLPFDVDPDPDFYDKAYKLTRKQSQMIKTMYNAGCQAFEIQRQMNRQLYFDIQNLHYIGPFRNNPQRIYRRDESVTNLVGHSGEYASDMLINDYISQGKLTESVSKWFLDSFGYSIQLHELKYNNIGSGYYQIVLQESNSTEERNIMDVGYGISQVLPIVIQFAEATIDEKALRRNSDNEFFVIEQPELHLHPAAQAKLANLFVRALLNGKALHRRILIETHSEHLIRALQVMIADPNCFINNKMVKIYYVDKDGEGESYIKEMEITEEGQFVEEWPSGFFDKSFELSRALLKAISLRKQDGK